MAREFDRSIKDKTESLTINVAVTEHGDWVHLNFRPYNGLWPCTTVLISNIAAAELAQALLEAVGAVQAVPAGWETVDTDTD